MAKQPVDTGRGRGSAKVKKAAGRNQKSFLTLLGLVAGVFAIFIVYQMNKPRDSGVRQIDPNTPLPTAQGYLMGNPEAPVQVIEFADFECPACANFFTLTEPDVKTRLVETGVISYRFMDLPLAMHPNTWHASNAAACANEQGKFWEMHDALFSTQDQWSGSVTRRPKGKMQALAKQVGLDVGKWEECFDSERLIPNIQAHEREAIQRGAGQTPTFIIGSRLVQGSISYDKFKAYVDTALAEAKARDTASVGDSAGR
jgi:protein-disulfide isomerase